jgi:hypothetical protein
MPNTPALKGVVVGYLGHSRYMAESVLPRWVRAATGRAHLDLGERSTQSLRVQAQHVIVTACRAHLDATAEVVSDRYEPLCSNCLRISRHQTSVHRISELSREH